MSDNNSEETLKTFSTQDENKITEIIDAFKDVSIIEKSNSESESISFTSAIEDSDIELTEEPDTALSIKNQTKKLNSFPQQQQQNNENNITKSISLNNITPIKENLGGVEIKSNLNPFTITLSCLLFEPEETDIIDNEIRYIYLNRLLNDDEQLYLAKLRRYAKTHEIKFPHVIWIQALRFLRSAQYHLQTAIDMMKNNHHFRINELPIYEKDVLDDLNTGAIYWHGRDHKFRPILIVKLAKLDQFQGDIQRIQKLLCFCLEFFLRYLQVAGRIENWNVIIDLFGKGITDLPIQILKSVLSLVNTRYRMRLFRMFIVNCPKFINVVSSALVAAIPGTSVHKIRFIDEAFSEEMINMIPQEQLEESYGGSCTNLTENFYPFRFYPMTKDDQNIPNLHSIIPIEHITGLSIEIPPKFDYKKLPWIKHLSKMNFTKQTALELSSLLDIDIKPKTTLEEIFQNNPIFI